MALRIERRKVMTGLLSLLLMGMVTPEGALAAPPAKKKAKEPVSEPAKDPAPVEQGPQMDKKMKLGFFEGFGLAAFQSGGSSYSGGATWKLTRPIMDVLDGRLGLGVLAMQGSSGLFFAAEYRLIASYKESDPLIFEGGAGAQTWFGNGGTRLFLSVEAALKFDEPWILGADRIFAGYGAFLSTPTTHELRAGIGFDLSSKPEGKGK